MFRQFLLGSAVSLVIPVAAADSPPRVAVDIAPVHSLVAQVMAGVGSPDLLIRPQASPHTYSLRPSEAEALSRAEVVFWMSEGITPWLEHSLANLAGSATQVKMLAVEGTALYDYREGATFESHDHHDGPQAEEHHDDRDPHAWLDPVNAKVWVKMIATVLSGQDAANAHIYQRNAEAAIVALDELIASIQQQAQSLEGIRFIVFHDAYQYFERRFGLLASGAIAVGDASDPSPARIEEIHETVAALGVTCVFTEPQYNPSMVRTVFRNTPVNTIGVMDPHGADIDVGKDHYPKLLNAMIASLNQCES
ncbi:MAG: zinc ABC transporter substrate-binding protein [Oleiphilaceae bacterium]|nr:zinc ABC transporter substrate-binding protein [Oleiphilaceae bacterium]